jgi:hypothetical protein
VPVGMGPAPDSSDLYAAIDDLLGQLPPAPRPPRKAGQVLAIVGDSTPALRAAEAVRDLLRLPEGSVHVAGVALAGDSGVGGAALPRINGRRDARRMRRVLRDADTPSIVVVGTDACEAESGDPWASELLEALRATTVWAMVDARSKTADARAALEHLGPVDAVAVYAAQRSSTPASVWELGLPIALLDGRPANAVAWSGVLFGLLRRSAAAG